MNKISSIIRGKSKAAASIYVVIFTTVLLSVIALSFMRIVLSEKSQTMGTDLSQSAYDSALAGTEDAKIALLKYHDCLNRGFTANRSKLASEGRHECEDIIKNMEDFMNNDSCDTVSKVLGRMVQNNSGSVIIDTVTDIKNRKTDGDGISKTLSQSYTCVKIKKNTSDYISTLDSENRSRIVPLRVENIDKIRSISLSWHSTSRYDKNSRNGILNSSKYQKNGELEAAGGIQDPFRPPMLKLEYMQVDALNVAGKEKDNFTLGQFYANNGQNTNRGFMILKPVKELKDNSVHNINAVHEINGFAASNDNAYNNFVEVVCNEEGINNSSYMCKAIIKLPRPFLNKKRSRGSTFLRVMLPHTDISTEFGLKLCTGADGTGCDNTDFGSVQSVIDATGRAADFYRRVESRVELIDTNFPYPEAAVSTPAGDFNKNFRITKECWTERGDCKNYKSPAE